MNDTPSTANERVALDPENPWLGLFSYTEETRAYFHGRDEEAAELARHVQRKTLAVLFGQSGLGKTSLLRAGLVPRLRGEGYCPVYVRIDYAAGSPAPSEQIKQAIFRATQAAGHWTRPGSAIEGESLWEFLHHRGDLLRDANGNTLMPLLIFDQFEEIFTLGQADDAGKLRAQQFLEDLADLVENRAPAALEARMEQDDNAAEDFDFARADYRVLIALREDYLAHLEGIKDSMPSITQNRMRLARMDGAQALSAVVKPGGKLVTREVAESIVRFVAGGSELANAEIEPSLLSLVCRELNNIRLSQQRREISTDLLAGSRDNILSEFYERALADQPAGVRRVVEDELLTESGYRESLAEERVKKALAAAGASPDTLATLVNRRLLRIEERLDMRRVELTHDVLCGVVLASRNTRREREAREDAERQLAAQREREAATHRALRRTRMIAGVCAVLMLLAIAGAAFGWYAMRRAQVAEEHARASRTNAENLVSFLIEDFYNELEPTGRLETLGKLAQKAVAYYDSLPPELRSQQTEINRAMALVREASAQSASGDNTAASKNFDAARAVFEKLRAAGDQGEPVAYGLALISFNEGKTSALGFGAGPLQRAADLLRPLVYGPNPSRRVLQLYADDLNYLSHTQTPQKSVETCQEARKILVGLGALELSDLNAAASWADTADSEARSLFTLGRIAESQALEQQVYAMAEKILARRPGDLHALADRYFAADLLARLAQRQYDHAAAADYAAKSVRAAEEEVRFNPSNLDAWSHWSVGFGLVAEQQFDRGDVAKAMATLHSELALAHDPRAPASVDQVLFRGWNFQAVLQAQTGDKQGAAKSAANFAKVNAESVAQAAPDDPRRPLITTAAKSLDAQLQLIADAPREALVGATAVAADVEKIRIPENDRFSASLRDLFLGSSLVTAAESSIRLGQYAQAEALARKWLALPANPLTQDDPRIKDSRARSMLAHAIALQGRGDEARKTLQPALDYFRQELKAGATGTYFRLDYAYALYVSAISQADDAAGAKQRKADLDAAAGQIAGASAEAQKLADIRYVSGLIAAARTKPM